jgi:hypothetical protein
MNPFKKKELPTRAEILNVEYMNVVIRLAKTELQCSKRAKQLERERSKSEPAYVR